MAPKFRAGPSVAKAPPVAKSRITKKSADAVNRWAHLLARDCFSCDQCSHSIDRDSPRNLPKFVHWIKTKGAGPKLRLAGRECQSCIHTRKQHFDMEMEELKKAREEDKAIEDKFTEIRHDFVSGLGEFKGSGIIDIKLIVQSAKKSL